MSMLISQVARQAGVGVETVRFYERKGLVTQPAKMDGSFRRYPAETVRRIRFIQRAKDLGFTLEEVGQLLELRARPDARCEKVRKRAQAKIENINEKMETLKAMRTALSRLLKECSGQAPITDCPILESLERGNG